MSDDLPPLPSHPEHAWLWTEAELLAIRAYALKAVEAEREACAVIAETSHPHDWAFIAAAIRNRSKE